MDLQMSLAARGNVYAAFAAIMGGSPSPDLLAAIDSELLEGSCAILLDDLREAKGDWNLEEADFSFLNKAYRIEDLQSGYTALFEGPGAPKAKPWESLHLSRQPRLFNEVTLSVRKFYRAMGVSVVQQRSVADDHIALELGFLRELATRSCEHCTECVTDSDSQAARYAIDEVAQTALSASKQFLHEHLLRWVGEFACCVEEAETCLRSGGFYSAGAKALQSFLQMDDAWIDVVEA